ncbi:MAG: hypothetical protein IJO71_09160 [Microbacterium sp.]|uniref:hypothetical protein n=1 Tax=Microbacterium sp. TaxID=51671 RepID=UPI0025E7F759|nr:hypothetical protein [Microbacterium sp.]MBQ9917354.1 hypothetical protein [Microbacterium sp.]
MTTTTTTTRGKKPADHQAPKGTAAQARDTQQLEEELLADLPELKPALKLRIGERNRLSEILLDAYASGLFGGSDDERSEGFDLDLDNPEDLAKYKQLNRLCEQIDEWAESIAVDREAYAEWAGGKQHDTYFAILNRYQEAQGESTGS